MAAAPDSQQTRVENSMTTRYRQRADGGEIEIIRGTTNSNVRIELTRGRLEVELHDDKGVVDSADIGGSSAQSVWHYAARRIVTRVPDGIAEFTVTIQPRA